MLPRRSLIALATALTMMLGAGVASAEVYVVTKRGDPEPDACKKRDCSLREAVGAANARAGRDVIELPNRRKPYVLGQQGMAEDGALSGDLDIANDPLVVKHPGRGRATVAANVFERGFEVFAGAPTTFRKLVIRGGHDIAGPEGGGIRSDADLKVMASRITGNDSAGRGGGSGLQNGAGLELVDSVVAGNEAGGGGGGIDDSGGAISIVRSRIVRNAGGDGGGLILGFAATARIVASTIAGNESADAGGGLYLDRPDPPTRIRNTTISGNRSLVGGGLYVNGSLELTNSTVASNRTAESGGGVAAAGPGTAVTLNAVTVARNVADADDDDVGSGGGLMRFIAPSFEVGNSLLALNRLGSGERNDCDGNQPFDSLGHNLVSTSAPSGVCEGFAGMSGPPSDIVDVAPRIGKLKRNGGPTKTIALRKRSPAINRAKRSSAPKRDQRGRPRGRKREIGAFERNTSR